MSTTRSSHRKFCEQGSVAVTMLACIWKIPGSNTGRDKSYPERIRRFPESLLPNTGTKPKLGHEAVPSKSFPINHSPIIQTSDVTYS